MEPYGFHLLQDQQQHGKDHKKGPVLIDHEVQAYIPDKKQSPA